MNARPGPTRLQINPRLQSKVDESDVVQQAILEPHKCRQQFRGTTEPDRIVWLRKIFWRMPSLMSGNIFPLALELSGGSTYWMLHWTFPLLGSSDYGR
jgi:hypothetical protein